MNTEFIKEIRKKAIIAWAANNGITVHKFMDEPENIEALEKFAELIVKECLDVGVKSGILDNDWNYPRYSKAIKEHFGFE